MRRYERSIVQVGALASLDVMRRQIDHPTWRVVAVVPNGSTYLFILERRRRWWRRRKE